MIPMAIFEKPPRYRAYLLTFWEERNQDPGEPPAWRFRLEDPRTGEQYGFANLERLVTALEEEIASKPSDGLTRGF
jgi:hypothetical protein